MGEALGPCPLGTSQIELTILGAQRNTRRWRMPIVSGRDRLELFYMETQARADMNVEKFGAVASRGYHEADEIENCEDVEKP